MLKRNLLYKQRNLLYYYVKKNLSYKQRNLLYYYVKKLITKILDFNKPKAWIYTFYLI